MPTGGKNLFGLTQFDGKESFFSGTPILSQGVGYAVVVGYGAFFVLLTGLLTFFDQRFGGTKDTSEQFNTAGRSINTGLVAVDVVSRWTWVATLTVSVNQAYLYGISGPFWFAAAAAIQLILFAIIALELKIKAPKAHTVIELTRLRWGHAAGVVFLYMCYLNNFVVCTLLFVGAGNILTATTGMNIYATVVLLPLGVVVYTIGGGLKATFTSSYLHTVIIFVTTNVFLFVIYASSSKPVGTIHDVYENLKVVAAVSPVKENKGGSFLTMYSGQGLKFGLFNLVGAFGTIFADQAYWQGAVAATPKAAFRGYILGGIMWVSIPFGFATALGLAALSVDLPISMKEYNAGLVCVAAAQFFMGTGGVVLILTVIFMSVTSAGSAELMAMSSLFTYDIYKTYINPKATNQQMLAVSRSSVFGFGILAGLTSCMCIWVGIDVNFLFFVGGLLLASAVVPFTALIMFPSVSAGAAIASALGGQIISIIAWLAHTQIVYKRMTVSDTLQRLGPTLDGTLVALLSSFVICVVWTLIAPFKGDGFARFKEIDVMDGVHVEESKTDQMHPWFNKYTLFAFPLSMLLLVAWPLLTLPAGVFSEQYFAFWVVLAMIWTIVATLVCTLLPLLEARRVLTRILANMLGVEMSPNDNRSILPMSPAQYAGGKIDSKGSAVRR